MNSIFIRAFVVIAALVAAVYFFWQGYWQSHVLRPALLRERMSDQTLSKRKPQSAQSLAEGPMKVKEPQVADLAPDAAASQANETGTESDDTLLAACQSDWESLVETELPRIRRDFEEGREVLGESCREAMLEQVKARPVIQFLIQCTGQAAQQRSSTCVDKLSLFRAFTARQLSEKSPREVADLETSNLVNQLAGGLVDPGGLSRDEVERNLRLADELIRRQPNLYSAYKAKLVNLLIQETQLGEPVEIEEYERLYSELLSFEVITQEDELLEEKAEVIEETEALNEQEGLDETGAAEGESPLIDSSSELTEDEVVVETYLIDEDLIHIPFVRQAALGQYDELIDMSEEYIEAYPESYIGYYYLAEGLWRSGDKGAAMAVLEEAIQQGDADHMLLKLFEQVQSKEASERVFEFPLYFEFQ